MIHFDKLLLNESMTCSHICVCMAQMRRQRASEFSVVGQLPQIETLQDFTVAAAANPHNAFLEEFENTLTEREKQMHIRINILTRTAYTSFYFSPC